MLIDFIVVDLNKKVIHNQVRLFLIHHAMEKSFGYLVDSFCQEFSSLMSLFTKSVAVTPLAGMPDLVSSTWDEMGSG